MKANQRRWGGVARRGAWEVEAGDSPSAAARWREAVEHDRSRRGENSPEPVERDRIRRDESSAEPGAPKPLPPKPAPPKPAPGEETPREAWQPETWIHVGEVRNEATRAVARGDREPNSARSAAKGGTTARKKAPRSNDEAARSAPVPGRGHRSGSTRDGEAVEFNGTSTRQAATLQARLKDAIRAFDHERFPDARRILRPLAEQAPGNPAVRELLGLTYYRLGKWKEAIRELEAFRSMTASTEQHPVLADAYRALGQHQEVGELWEELRATSPGADLVAEGRIVAAGSLADRGELDEAIRLVEAGVRNPKRIQTHHLRLWYALADLYERAGDVPRARELFRRIEAEAGEFADVDVRLRALG